MRLLLVHNRYRRYRSGAPSGENRVVDQEGEALEALGHEVVRFGRSSDEIAEWPVAKKASLPTRAIWSRETRRDLTTVLREHRPEVVHVHNTFPLLSAAVLYACRDDYRRKYGKPDRGGIPMREVTLELSAREPEQVNTQGM